MRIGCKVIDNHVHFACDECNALRKRLICQKCRKFTKFRITVKEKLWSDFFVHILVCEECHKKKRNTCDFCEKNENRVQTFYNSYNCPKASCDEIATHFHIVCFVCDNTKRDSCDKCGKFCSSID